VKASQRHRSLVLLLRWAAEAWCRYFGGPQKPGVPLPQKPGAATSVAEVYPLLGVRVLLSCYSVAVLGWFRWLLRRVLFSDSIYSAKRSRASRARPTRCAVALWPYTEATRTLPPKHAVAATHAPPPPLHSRAASAAAPPLLHARRYNLNANLCVDAPGAGLFAHEHKQIDTPSVTHKRTSSLGPWLPTPGPHRTSAWPMAAPHGCTHRPPHTPRHTCG
jgi:hypothetical protein